MLLGKNQRDLENFIIVEGFIQNAFFKFTE